MSYKHKTIGTSIPLFSLKSQSSKNHTNGTIEDGLEFIDWLSETNQSAWQLLPIHETHLIKDTDKHVPSPYKGYGIGIDPRYLTKNDMTINQDEYSTLLEKNSYWIYDYALFCAARDYHKTDDWTTWESGIKKRDEESIKIWGKNLEKSVQHYVNQQIIIHHAFNKLRSKSKEKNILLVGDLSFYLPLQSPLVWQYQELFEITSDGKLSAVSGLPLKESPMYGRQIWGHPLYRWDDKDKLNKILSLFSLRLKYLSNLFDMIRIDHANGFFHYGAVHTSNPIRDEMKKGPGFIALKHIKTESERFNVSIYAEDAATTLNDLRNAMNKLKIPGFRVFRYAYDKKFNLFLDDYVNLNSYPKNNVAFTTTHDTETLVGFLNILDEKEKSQLTKRVGIANNKDNKSLAKALRNAVINSPSRIILIPIQDWLLSADRINIPGTETDVNDLNWRYRMPELIENLPIVNETIY